MPGLPDARVEDPIVRNQILGYFGEKYNIATRVLPIMNVPKRANFIPAFGKELRRQVDTIVAPKQVKPVRDFTLGRRAVETRDRYSAWWLSDQEIEEWSANISPERFCQQEARKDIWRDIELEVANFVMNAGNWAAAAQQAAAAAWANIAFDIPGQIDTQATVVENAIGIPRAALTLVVGNPVWPWIRRNTAVRLGASIALGRRENVQAPIGFVTEEIVAKTFDVKAVIGGRAKIAADVAGAAFGNAWDDDVALMYIPENVAETEPEAMPFGTLARREGHPKAFAPYRDMRYIGNPYIYEAEDCIYRNLFETDTGLGTSEAGFAWFNAV